MRADRGELTDAIEVRVGGPDDVHHAAAAAELIREAAPDFDIAVREPSMLAQKIASGRAALALRRGELVGFGYFSEWEGGRFVSHSGLVTRPDVRGHGLGRRLKLCLFEASRRMFPRAATMSLTTSPAVLALNRSLGFEDVDFSDLTSDPAFWEGCKTCRNYEEMQRQGKRCCCTALLLRPQPARDGEHGSGGGR